MDIQPWKNENYRMRLVGELRGQTKPKKSAWARPFFEPMLSAAILYLCFSGPVFAQTPNSSGGNSNQSWSSTTVSNPDDANPTRTIESHTQNGDRTVDVHSVQARGSDGSFQPYQDIETETVQVNANTTRTTTRTFVRDDSGTKTLFQITEEEKRTLPGGDSKSVRTTSNPDADGKLQVVQRELQETKKISSDVEATKTTVMLPGIDGSLAPAMLTQERRKQNGDTVEIQKTTQLPDGNGSWQAAEVKHTTIKDDGKNHSSEERVSRPDGDGKLGEVSRTVRKESEDGPGVIRESKETYSVDLPGAAQDSSLRLAQRVTTTQHSDAAGQHTIESVEQSNPADPGTGLRVTTINTDTVRLGPAGAQAVRTIQVSDANGNVGVVSVDMSKSNSAQAIEVQIAPSKH